jgi:DNA polymerase III epsilon subunit-like protein
MHYIAMDTETGGIDPKKASLLTAYFAILDENFNAIAELDLKIKNDKNEVYQVTGEALKINGINLAEHHANNRNCTKGLAAIQLSDLITKYSEFGKELLTPIGHNLAFDVGFVNEHLVPKDLWDRSVSYRVLDTAVIANFLKIKGVIPKETSGSLSGLAKFFGINTEAGALHSAKFDTIVTVSLLEKMLKA